MPVNQNVEQVFKAGIDIRTKLVLPVLSSDPGSPQEGWAWFNGTSNLFKYYDGTTTIELGAAAGLDAEGVQDIIGAMVTGNTESGIAVTYDDSGAKLNFSVAITSSAVSDFAEAAQDAIGAVLTDSATVDLTYNDGAGTITATVLDSPTVEGQNVAALTASITAAIIDSAPGTLDTLNEIAAALGDDPNFVTTITNLIAAKSSTYEGTLTGGTLTEVVTHNLNTRAVNVSVYKNSGTYDEDEEFLIRHTSVNTITVVSEAGNLPSGYKVVVTAKGS